MAIKTKRVYEPYTSSDGYRVLVDRLWPRGVKKEDAHVNEWMKEVAPSNALRKWFNHEPGKWKQFTMKYHAELIETKALEELISLEKDHKIITLIYSAKNEQYNQAVALKEFLAG